MGAKAGVIVLGATLVFGIIVGQASAPDAKTEYKVLHDTKTVTETETVEVATVPQSCLDAAQFAETILLAGKQYEETTTAMLDILSDVRRVAMTKDTMQANDIETRLRQLYPETINAAETLGTDTQPFHDAAIACKKASNE